MSKLSDCTHILNVVATPIGNISEITLRAIEILENAEVIFCEDTRVSKKLYALLKISPIKKIFISFHKYNENDKLNMAIELIKTKSCVLVSDAGYPCISDPGYILINKCYINNIGVKVINGPSSIIHAAVVSGIDISNFIFIGFLNSNQNQRIKRLKILQKYDLPLIFFESVHRIKVSLMDMKQVLGDRYVVVCRELTKQNETIYRGKISEVISQIYPKGEFVIVVDKDYIKVIEPPSQQKLIDEIKKLISSKIKTREACKIIGEKYNLKSNMLYELILGTHA